jgi:hypothetical protein
VDADGPGGVMCCVQRLDRERERGGAVERKGLVCFVLPLFKGALGRPVFFLPPDTFLVHRSLALALLLAVHDRPKAPGTDSSSDPREARALPDHGLGGYHPYGYRRHR